MKIASNVVAIIDRFMHSPEAAAILARQQEQAQAERKRQAAEIATLVKQAEGVARDFDAKLKKSEAHLVAMKAAYDAALEAHQANQFGRMGQIAELERRADRLRYQLADTASPRIGESVTELRRLSAEMQYDHARVPSGAGEIWSNKDSFDRRYAAIREAISTVQSWQHEALTDDEIDRKFAALVANLPALDVRPWAVASVGA
jgi:chromosome segregation ATPase